MPSTTPRHRASSIALIATALALTACSGGPCGSPGSTATTARTAPAPTTTAPTTTAPTTTATTPAGSGSPTGTQASTDTPQRPIGWRPPSNDTPSRPSPATPPRPRPSTPTTPPSTAPGGAVRVTMVPAPVFWNVRGPSRGFNVPGPDDLTYEAVIGNVAEPVPDTAAWVPVGYGFHAVEGVTRVHIRPVAKPGYELANPTGWMAYFGPPPALAAPNPRVMALFPDRITVLWDRPEGAPPTTTYSVVVTDMTGGGRGKPVLRQQNEPKLACDVPIRPGKTVEIQVVANADAGGQISQATLTYTFGR